jgi:hypothetical protein
MAPMKARLQWTKQLVKDGGPRMQRNMRWFSNIDGEWEITHSPSPLTQKCLFYRGCQDLSGVSFKKVRQPEFLEKRIDERSDG